MGLGINATKTTTATGAAGDISVVERIERSADPRSAASPSVTPIWPHASAWPSLVVLNIVDLVLTKRFLALGLAEGNPLMVAAVQSWHAAACKAAILGGLIWSFARRPATATRLALVYAGVGLYLLSAYVNFGAIRSAEAMLR